MTIETVCMAGSTLAAAASLTAAFLGRKPQRLPGRTLTITIEDPVSGLVRTVVHSTRRADQIRRDVERAIREGC
jgi:hypothetical protein